MNDGKNGFVGPVLIAAAVIFEEEVVHLQGKSPWVGLYRSMWFQFLVPELGGYVCTALHCNVQTSFVHNSMAYLNLEQEL